MVEVRLRNTTDHLKLAEGHSIVVQNDCVYVCKNGVPRVTEAVAIVPVDHVVWARVTAQ